MLLDRIFMDTEFFTDLTEGQAFFYVEEQDGALLVRQPLKSRIKQCFIFVPFGLQGDVCGHIRYIPAVFERFIQRLVPPRFLSLYELVPVFHCGVFRRKLFRNFDFNVLYAVKI